MKKIIMGLAGVAIAYTAASWYTGYQGEKLLRAQFELNKSQLASTGLSYEISRYDRGIFSSRYELVAKLDRPAPQLGSYSFTGLGQVQHGPLLWASGLGFGLMDYRLEPRFHFDNPDINQAFTQVFGESLGELKLRAHFDKSYSGKWLIKPISIEGENGKFVMAASEVLMSGQLDKLAGQGKIALGAIEFTTKEKLQGKLSPVAGDFSVESLEPGIFIYNYDLQLAESQFTNAMGITMTLSNLGLNMNQAVNDNALDSSMKLSLAKFSGPLEVTNGYYEVKVNKLSLDALRSWSKAYRDTMAEAGAAGGEADPQAMQLALMGLIGSELPNFLQKGLNLQVNLGAEFMGGKPNAHWEVNYIGPVEGKTLADLTDTQEYLALADSELLVRAPAMLLGALPVDQYLDTYITQDGNDYLLKASLHQGALKVGTVDIPQEQLLAMAGAFVGGFQKAIASQADAGADANEDMSDEAIDDDGYEAEDGEESSADDEQ